MCALACFSYRLFGAGNIPLRMFTVLKLEGLLDVAIALLSTIDSTADIVPVLQPATRSSPGPEPLQEPRGPPPARGGGGPSEVDLPAVHETARRNGPGGNLGFNHTLVLQLGPIQILSAPKQVAFTNLEPQLGRINPALPF